MAKKILKKRRRGNKIDGKYGKIFTERTANIDERKQDIIEEINWG